MHAHAYIRLHATLACYSHRFGGCLRQWRRRRRAVAAASTVVASAAATAAAGRRRRCCAHNPHCAHNPDAHPPCNDISLCVSRELPQPQHVRKRLRAHCLPSSSARPQAISLSNVISLDLGEAFVRLLASRHISLAVGEVLGGGAVLCAFLLGQLLLNQLEEGG